MKGAKILVLGVAYKRDIDDVRESPSLDIIELLAKRGARVSFHDPFISTVMIGDKKHTSVALNADVVASADAVLISTDHSAIDYGMIVKKARLVFDARNATKKFGLLDNVVKL